MKANLYISALIGLMLVSITSTAHGECRRSGPNRGNERIGNVLGGIIGGVIGNQFGKGDGKTALTIAGAIGGAIIGGEIGCDLDEEDRNEIYRTRHDYFNSDFNRPYRWRSRRYEGDIIYTRPGYMMYGSQRIDCREYQSVIYAGGREERSSGSVCRFADGTIRDVETRQVIYNDGFSTSVTRESTRVMSPRSPIINHRQFNDLMFDLDQSYSDNEKIRIVVRYVNMFGSYGLRMTSSQAADVLSTIRRDNNKNLALQNIRSILIMDSGSSHQILNQYNSPRARSYAWQILNN